MYYTLTVNLTNRQKNAFANAIANKKNVKITFRHYQLEQAGDTILITKSQFDKLNNAKMSNSSVSITFGKKQIQEMGQQMGNGILDSIGNFFKSGYNSAKNWVSSKVNTKPKPIEMKNMANLRPKVKNPDYFRGYDNVPLDEPKQKQPSTFDRVAQKVNDFDSGVNKFFNPGTPFGITRSKLNEWKGQKNGYSSNGFYPEDF